MTVSPSASPTFFGVINDNVWRCCSRAGISPMVKRIQINAGHPLRKLFVGVNKFAEDLFFDILIDAGFFRRVHPEPEIERLPPSSGRRARSSSSVGLSSPLPASVSIICSRDNGPTASLRNSPAQRSSGNSRKTSLSTGTYLNSSACSSSPRGTGTTSGQRRSLEPPNSSPRIGAVLQPAAPSGSAGNLLPVLKRGMVFFAGPHGQNGGIAGV